MYLYFLFIPLCANRAPLNVGPQAFKMYCVDHTCLKILNLAVFMARVHSEVLHITNLLLITRGNDSLVALSQFLMDKMS